MAKRLLEAAQSGDIYSARDYLLLVPEAINNQEPREGYTALHMASFWGQSEMCKFLLDNGADINAINNAGRTPLYLAAYREHFSVCDVLMERGAEMDMRSSSKKAITSTSAKMEPVPIMSPSAQKGKTKSSKKLSPAKEVKFSDATKL